MQGREMRAALGPAYNTRAQRDHSLRWGLSCHCRQGNQINGIDPCVRRIASNNVHYE